LPSATLSPPTLFSSEGPFFFPQFRRQPPCPHLHRVGLTHSKLFEAALVIGQRTAQHHDAPDFTANPFFQPLAPFASSSRSLPLTGSGPTQLSRTLIRHGTPGFPSELVPTIPFLKSDPHANNGREVREGALGIGLRVLTQQDVGLDFSMKLLRAPTTSTTDFEGLHAGVSCNPPVERPLDIADFVVSRLPPINTPSEYGHIHPPA